MLVGIHVCLVSGSSVSLRTKSDISELSETYDMNAALENMTNMLNISIF